MEPLSRVPNVELWKVENSGEQLLAQGEWILSLAGSVVVSQVGNVVWHLARHSACLKPGERSYVFAINTEHKIYYCVNLPEDTPEGEQDVIETVLDEFTSYKLSPAFAARLKEKNQLQKVPGQKSKTDMIVKSISTVTDVTVRGLAASADFVSKKIRAGGDMVKERTEPCAEPNQVTDKTRKRVEDVKKLSKAAAGVAHAAVDIVAGLTSQVANMVIGTKEKSDKPAGSVKRVGAAVVVAAAEVFEAMEYAAKSVAKSSAEATRDVVHHKYGEDMGQVSYDGMSAAGHIADTAWVARRLGPKAVLKSTAKKTATGFLVGTASASDGSKPAQSQSNVQPNVQPNVLPSGSTSGSTSNEDTGLYPKVHQPMYS